MRAFDAVFLDRDGTINVKPPEESYVCSPSQLRLLPGAGEAIRALNDAGLLVLVVTNQRGVASQKMSLSDVHEVHRALAAHLGRFGARVDGFYICPHADETCGCRKPEPGLLLQASRDYPGLRLGRTVLIGDSETDVKAASCRRGLSGQTGSERDRIGGALRIRRPGFSRVSTPRSRASRPGRLRAWSTDHEGRVSERLTPATG